MEEKKRMSRFVCLYRDDEDDLLVVLGQAVNKGPNAKYVIEFEREEIDLISNSYPFREFEGFFANFKRTDAANNKVYVEVTFRQIDKKMRQRVGKRAIPGFKLNLLKSDRELAMKVLNQINDQALEMEANTQKAESWGM